MKKEDLFEVIGEIDSEIVEKPRKTIPLWIKFTAAAACLVVTIAGIKIAGSFNITGTPTTIGNTVSMFTMETKQEAGGINDLNTMITDGKESDKIIYDGAQIGSEIGQAATENETNDVFIPYPDAENATQRSDLYAGCYLNEKQELVVLLTKDTPENRKTVCADLNIEMDNVIFKEAKYSKAYLDSIHNEITEVMIARKFETIVTSGVMEMENYVEVTLTEEDAEAIAFLNWLDDTGAINIVYGAVSTTNMLIA
ncbi:MAG: hypothetical protein IKV63_01345, partial [Clostridia bacterium]|nr:hypothetical protein [Clostridia bacterium]